MAVAFGTGFVDREGVAVDRLALHAIDGSLTLGIAGHFDEGEAASGDDADSVHVTERGKSGAQGVIGSAGTQISNVNILHAVLVLSPDGFGMEYGEAKPGYRG